MATATLAPALPAALDRHDTRLRFIAALPPAAHVLDAGCGAFKTQRKLIAARPDLRFTGVDMLDVGHDCPAGSSFYRLDFESERLPFPDQHFDGIFFCHVMEHLANRFNVLAEFSRVLKPGGRIYIEGPSTCSIWLPSLPALPSRSGTAIGDDLNFFDNFTHVRPLSRRGLQMFLEMAGCQCQASGAVRHWRKLLLSPLLLVGGLLARRRRWVCLALWELCGWSDYAIGEKQAPEASSC
ncbi:MAG: class I SAM-dependent methyltransferase [Terriglobales bacterium]